MKSFDRLFIILTLFAVIFASCSSSKWDLEEGLYAEFNTNRGSMVFELFVEDVPLTVANFVGLAEGVISHNADSKEFYNGLRFFSKKEQLMIISGNPTEQGFYDPGYSFPDEFYPGLHHDEAGYLSMYSAGQNNNGSQFIITLNEAPQLDNRNSIFGKIADGQTVLDSLEEFDVIESVKILRIGEKYKQYQMSQTTFENMLKSAWNNLMRSQSSALADQEAMADQKYPGSTSLPSGLRYIVLEEGSGKSPSDGDTVIVTYTESLLDHTILVSSEDRGKMRELVLSDNLQLGLREGLKLMKSGGKRILIIPPQMAYGLAGFPGIIPENSFIVYEITLHEVK